MKEKKVLFLLKSKCFSIGKEGKNENGKVLL